jgi:[ribosomal protein S5]-alanine N-acetyltransferase
MTPPNRDLVITTPRLTLRATHLSDVPRFVEIESNWNVAKMLRTAPWPVIEANMAAWVATHPQEWVDGTAYRFTFLRDEVVIGMCDIGGIVDQWGGFGYWLDEAFWGHGYTKEAASAVLAFARDQVGMKGFKSGHIAENAASGKILRFLGFRELAQETRYATPRGEDVPYIPYVLEA